MVFVVCRRVLNGCLLFAWHLCFKPNTICQALHVGGGWGVHAFFGEV